MRSTTSWRSSPPTEPSAAPSPSPPRTSTLPPGPDPQRPDLAEGQGSPARRAATTLIGTLGWAPRDTRLVELALAHRSWCAENSGTGSNERLEFLGDAVLGLVVTDHLYRTYPEMPEGELAKVRASVVNSASLAEIAADLDVGEALLLGKGEDTSGGREKPSILADAMEALIGAVYLDRGWEVVEPMVMALCGERIESAAIGPGGQDYKTRLQEMCARRYDQLPLYSVRDEGPDHAKEFEAVVHVAGRPTGTGRGRSKKQAEQAAARAAWEQLGGDSGNGSAAGPAPGPAPGSPGAGALDRASDPRDDPDSR